MTKGRELPINSKVRRQLFFEDEPKRDKPAECTGQDYFSRVTKTEFVDRNMRNEAILNGMKWNFDFKNEVALDGPIQWYRKANSREWVGMQPTEETVNMRKRKLDPESATKSYDGERCKETRLSLHAVLISRSFFNDERTLENAKIQAEDDNFANAILDEIQPTLRAETGAVNLLSEENPDVAEKEYVEATEEKVDEMEKEDEAGKGINESLSNVVTENARVYGNRDMIGDELQYKINVTGNSEINSEDKSFIPEDNLEYLEISEIINKSDKEEQVIPEEKLNDTIRRQNQVTPRNDSNDSVPPARKMKVTKEQVLRKRAKRRISFD